MFVFNVPPTAKVIWRQDFTLNLDPQFNLDFGVKVTQNVAIIPSTSCDLCISKFEVATSNGLGGVQET